MNTLEKFFGSISQAFEFNQATLSGCMDIIVIQQQDGSLKSTPFHARFGKFKVLKSKDKIVKIHVNGCEASFSMKLGPAGEAFFEEEIQNSIYMSRPSQYLVQDSIILPDGDVSSDEGKKDYVKTGGLSDMLRMRHTESNQSTSANSQSQGEEKDNTNTNPQDSKINLSGKTDMREKLNGSFLLKENQSTKSVFTSTSSSRKLRVKTLRPSSDLLKTLNLRLGANTITYTVLSRLQGIQTISASIYCWPHDANIIISDVDGTITKTDVLGHILPMFGRDWSQPGIAPLFTNLRRNGYYILYLTSRPIGQAPQTKEFLQSVYQDGNMLPHGPLIMSPDRMLPSVKRELLYRRPELFKMAALKDIRSLFSIDHNPFHAGFGNRETDLVSYKSVGIPLEKVFIVDSQGDIKHHNSAKKKSYALINTMIKDIFPGIIKREKCKLVESLDEANVLKLENQVDIEENTMKVVS